MVIRKLDSIGQDKSGLVILSRSLSFLILKLNLQALPNGNNDK